jgi:hypothetical protein
VLVVARYFVYSVNSGREQPSIGQLVFWGPSEFGQQSTLREKRVNSINNLQEQTLQTARQPQRHSKVVCFQYLLIVTVLYRPNSETTPNRSEAVIETQCLPHNVSRE